MSELISYHPNSTISVQPLSVLLDLQRYFHTYSEPITLQRGHNVDTKHKKPILTGDGLALFRHPSK